MEVRKAVVRINQVPIPFLRAVQSLNKVDLGQSPEKGLRVRAKETDVLFALHSLDGQARESAVTANLLRRRIMTCYHHLGIHLTKSIWKKACQLSRQISIGSASSNKNSSRPDLVARLVPLVHNQLENRTNFHFILSSSELVDTMFNPPISMIDPPRVFKFYDKGFYTGDSLHERTADIVVDTIRYWFELADEELTQARVTFLGLLIKHLGYGAFLMPSVWAAFTSMPRWLVKDLADNNLHDTLCRLEIMLIKSEVSDVESPAFHKLFNLTLEYNRMQEEMRTLAQKHSQMTEQISSNIVDPSFEVDKTIAAGILPSSNKGPSSLLNATDAVSMWINRVTKLLVFANQVAIYQDALQPNSLVQTSLFDLPTLNPLQKTILDNGDYLQPFRELAPTRTLMNERLLPSPVNTSKSYLACNLFSVIVVRNITFRSPYLLQDTVDPEEKRVYFKDATDFKNWMDYIAHAYPEASNKESFFCNKKAFSGQTLHTRSIHSVDKCWKLATHKDFEVLLTSNNNCIPWKSARLTLASLKEKLKVPGLGALTQYLVLADLCCHGVVTMPSVEEMGIAIRRLNAGAMKGLRCCALLPKDDSLELNEAQVVQAFTYFYEQVDKGLKESDMEMNRYNSWNTVVAEHTLCKIHRLQKKMTSYC